MLFPGRLITRCRKLLVEEGAISLLQVRAVGAGGATVVFVRHQRAAARRWPEVIGSDHVAVHRDRKSRRLRVTWFALDDVVCTLRRKRKWRHVEQPVDAVVRSLSLVMRLAMRRLSTWA